MSAYGSQGSGYEAWQQGGDVQPKLSILAVMSLVLSILCITAPLGLICGIAAIFTISASAGRKTGRGLAIAGIIIGLLCSSLMVAVAVGVQQVAVAYSREVVTPTANTVAAIEKKDYATVRTALTPSTDAAVTDADIDAFSDELASKAGASAGAPTSAMEIFRLWSDTANTMKAPQQGRGGAMMPLPLPFAKGPVMFLIHLDPSGPAVPGKPGSVQNLQALFADGTNAWLVDPLKLGLSNAVPSKPMAPSPPKTATPETPAEKTPGGEKSGG